MNDLKRSKITEVHREEARKLKALWEVRPHRTQAQFGEAYNLGNQSNVGHYLNARSPLNLGAALAFSTELGVEISEFSPRLAQQRNEFAHGVQVQHSSAIPSPQIEETLASYRVVSLELALERVASYLSTIGDYNTNTVTALFETLANDPSLHEVVAAGLRKIKPEKSTHTKQGAPAIQGDKSRAA